MSGSPEKESDPDYLPSDEQAPGTVDNKHRASSDPQESHRKRQKVRDDRVKPPIAILPAPSMMASYPYPNPNEPFPAIRSRPRTVLNAKRSSALNLKNYPSHHHPTGIGIWILQKVEQMNRDRRENSPTTAPVFGSQPPNHSVVTASSYPLAALHRLPNVPARSTPYNADQVKEEVEEARLQSQRDRKSKQRQENWVKSEFQSIYYQHR